MRKQWRFMGAITLILVAMCALIWVTDHPSCSGSEQPRHCVD